MEKIEIGIIGGGFAGLGAAIQLQKNGSNDFIIFERASQIGGTWRDNTYPGCGCDIKSHLYSYSFEPNPNWSLSFSKQPEILNYLHHCVHKYNLEKYLKLDTNITEFTFSEKTGRWLLTATNGQQFDCKLLILAIGPLNIPNIPKLEGLEDFEGEYFHSAEWDHAVDLDNKKVAVIGTGASAIQLVPEVAKKVKKLTVFQRTAPWVFPKADKKISDFSKKIFSKLPFVQKLNRELIYWSQEADISLFTDNFVRKITKSMAMNHIRKQIKDTALRKKVTPNYEVGCKRRLPSNDYYPTLNKEHVELITGGAASIQKKGVVDRSGQVHPAEVIIFATGFEVSNFLKRKANIIGLNKKNLFELWNKEGGAAYCGSNISGFPNMIFLLGPNTGLGHNSQIHILESQYEYMLQYVKKLQSIDSNSSINVKKKAQDQFQETLHEKLKDTVWNTGCQSWYLNKDGKNVTLWPGSTYSFRKATQTINWNDFEILRNK